MAGHDSLLGMRTMIRARGRRSHPTVYSPRPLACSQENRMCRAVLVTLLLPIVALADSKPLFDGKTLAGWEGDTAKTWRVEDGAIAGGSLDAVVPRNEFLCTTKSYG